MTPHVHISHTQSPPLTRSDTDGSPSSDGQLGTSPCPIFSEAMLVRKEVFVDEQQVPAELELDHHEDTAWHWVAFVPDADNDTTERGLQKITVSSRMPETTMRRAGTVRLILPHHYTPQSPEFLPLVAIPDVDRAEIIKAAADGFDTVRERLPLFAKITRLAVSSDARTHGIGRALVEEAERSVAVNGSAWKSEIKSNGDNCVILVVHGQKTARKFWERIGYQVDPELGGGSWIEDGIDHVGMWKRISLV